MRSLSSVVTFSNQSEPAMQGWSNGRHIYNIRDSRWWEDIAGAELRGNLEGGPTPSQVFRGTLYMS